MAWKFFNESGQQLGLSPSLGWNFYDSNGLIQGPPPPDDRDHVHGLARWKSALNQVNFDLPDFAEYIEAVADDGAVVDPLIYSLSSDRSQVVFDTTPGTDSIIQAQYVIARL